MDKTALICGVSGQDGAYLAQFLLGKGYAVCGTSRDAHTASFSNLERLGIRDRITTVSMGLVDPDGIRKILRRTQPDEIYNLAGQSSVGLSFEKPVETFESIALATLNLLEAVRHADRPIRLYSACSTECFGDTHGEAATESSPFRPRSPYAVAKAAAFWGLANYRDAYGLYACSGILSSHESPLRPERFVTKKIIAAAARIAHGSKEKLSLGNVSVRRDWGWAPEYVEAMWLMLQQEQPDDYIVSTGEHHSLQEFIEAVFGCLGLDWRQYVVVEQSLLRPSELSVVRADPAKAKEVLGWEARTRMKRVIALMVEAEQQSLPVPESRQL